MKRILTIILLVFTISCTSFNISNIKSSIINNSIFTKTEEEKFKERLSSYSLEAKIITDKGDINIYLYPEAAPETVANFVFLSKKGFYDNMSFHRIVPNILVQAGDVAGDSTGTAGYYINDEFDSWIKFDSQGILAMANARKQNTASSQFFITLTSNPKYNGNYTGFGTLVSKDDINVVKSLRIGDRIKTIEIGGYNANDFLSNFKNKVSIWEKEYRK